MWMHINLTTINSFRSYIHLLKKPLSNKHIADLSPGISICLVTFIQNEHLYLYQCLNDILIELWISSIYILTL